jgi:hypothetical protein
MAAFERKVANPRRVVHGMYHLQRSFMIVKYSLVAILPGVFHWIT